MLYVLPIESLEERYSAHWNENFPAALAKEGVRFVTVHPEMPHNKNKISRGQFLDVVRTNEFKAKQLAWLLNWVDEGRIKDGDVIFLHDGWFPGIEMLFYVRDGLGLKFKIAVMLHAGTYDPHDFLSQKKMGRWAAAMETAWWSEVDAVFVATNSHREMLLKERFLGGTPVRVTGFPLFEEPLILPYLEKQNIVVFPHRLAPEKQPEEFEKLKELCSSRLPDWQFIRTKDVCKNKQEYHELLCRSKIAVSCALQETWGIAQQEALFRGCLPVVPDRLSYVELYNHAFRYKSLEQAAEMIIDFALNWEERILDYPFEKTISRCHNRSLNAVPTMIKTMRELGWQI